MEPTHLAVAALQHVAAASPVRTLLALRRRFDTVPGLTCHWQVRGRAELDFERQLALDLDYLGHHNLALDLRLLCQTVSAVWSGRGAYG